jgi:hypothetical protein
VHGWRRHVWPQEAGRYITPSFDILPAHAQPKDFLFPAMTSIYAIRGRTGECTAVCPRGARQVHFGWDKEHIVMLETVHSDVKVSSSDGTGLEPVLLHQRSFSYNGGGFLGSFRLPVNPFFAVLPCPFMFLDFTIGVLD